MITEPNQCATYYKKNIILIVKNCNITRIPRTKYYSSLVCLYLKKCLATLRESSGKLKNIDATISS